MDTITAEVTFIPEGEKDGVFVAPEIYIETVVNGELICAFGTTEKEATSNFMTKIKNIFKTDVAVNYVI